jgi:histidyl-tRNA synthetase
VRAYVQHRPTTPWKAWYVAPSFRYEAPQAGRFRQHHQLGVEALGSDDPDLDVEILALQAGFYRELGLRQVTLKLNSLGDGQCRPAYRQMLLDYLVPRRHELCSEHRDRIEANPLRVLDCKRPPCVAATADAPMQLDHLCDPCEAHFARVRLGLDALGITYTLTPRLVRGLDYYTRTTFEFAATSLDAAQDAVGGGGRYDGLAEALGGPPTPGIGFGAGIERILLACDAEGVQAAPTSLIDVFVIDTTGGESARDVAAELRSAGLRVDRAFDGRSMKAQLKAADRSGAALAIIIGSDELAAGTATVRDLRQRAEQEAVGRADLADHIRKRIQQL